MERKTVGFAPFIIALAHGLKRTEKPLFARKKVM
jgi:hypothetical protein